MYMKNMYTDFYCLYFPLNVVSEHKHFLCHVCSNSCPVNNYFFLILKTLFYEKILYKSFSMHARVSVYG